MAKQVKINNPFNINANIVISNDGILSNAPTTSGIYGATSLSPTNFPPLQKYVILIIYLLVMKTCIQLLVGQILILLISPKFPLEE